jgi:hypothetical protein
MTMNLNSPLFDSIRVPPRIGAKVMGEAMCREAGVNPDLVRLRSNKGRNGNREIEELRIRIAARMVSHHILWADILNWFEGFTADTISRWAREAKRREEA